VATDYKVQRRTRDQVAERASDMRVRLGVDHYYTFNIVKLIRGLKGRAFGSRGCLDVQFYVDRDDPAFVTFDPLVLHVHKEVWDEAELGEPKARFILAHELGHIVMHGDYRQEFTETDEEHLRSFPPEERSEPQANWFAAEFLAPDYLAVRCQNDSELCMSFDFPRDFVHMKQHLFELRSKR
jgi:hypothetical protein